MKYKSTFYFGNQIKVEGEQQYNKRAEVFVSDKYFSYSTFALRKQPLYQIDKATGKEILAYEDYAFEKESEFVFSTTRKGYIGELNDNLIKEAIQSLLRKNGVKVIPYIPTELIAPDYKDQFIKLCDSTCKSQWEHKEEKLQGKNEQEHIISLEHQIFESKYKLIRKETIKRLGMTNNQITKE